MPLAVGECDREREEEEESRKEEEEMKYLLDGEERGRDLLDPDRSAVARARRQQSGDIMALIGLFICNSGYGRLGGS